MIGGRMSTAVVLSGDDRSDESLRHLRLSRFEKWLAKDSSYHCLRHFHLAFTTLRYAATAGFGFAQSYLNSAVVLSGEYPPNLEDYQKHLISLITGGVSLAYAGYIFGNLRNPSPSEVAETTATAPISAQQETGTEEMAALYDVMDLIRLCGTKQHMAWLLNLRKALITRQVLAGIHPLFDSIFGAGTIADYSVFIHPDWKNDKNKQANIQLIVWGILSGVGVVSYISRYLLVRSMRLRFPTVPDEHLQNYPGFPSNKLVKSRLIVPGLLNAIRGLALGVYSAMFVLDRRPTVFAPRSVLYNGLMWTTGGVFALVYGGGGLVAETNYQLQVDPIIRDYKSVYEQLKVRQPQLLVNLPKPPQEHTLSCCSCELPRTRIFWLGMLWGLLSSIFEAMAMNNVYRAAKGLGSDITPNDRPSDEERGLLGLFMFLAIILGVWNQYNIGTRDDHVQTYRDGLIELKKRLLRVEEAPPEQRAQVAQAIEAEAREAQAAASHPEAATEAREAAELAAAAIPANTLTVAGSMEPLIEIMNGEAKAAESPAGAVHNVAGPFSQASPNAYKALDEEGEKAVARK